MVAQDFFNWAVTVGNSNANEVNDMVIDDDENVYIVGNLTGTIDLDPSANVVNLTPSGATGVYLAKYDKTGALVWAELINAQSGTDVIVNSGGSILVYGTMIGTATIGTNTITNTLSNTATATYIAAFSSSGAYQGGKAIESVGNQESFDIKSTPDNHLYITGSFTNSIDLGTSLSTTESSQRGTVKDLYIARLDNMGNFVWAKTVATNHTSSDVQELEVDSNGVYLVGTVLEDLDFDNGTNLQGTKELNVRGYLTKLDNDGNFQWTKRSRGTSNSTSSGRSLFSSVEIDTDGNISLVGFVQRRTTVDGFTGILNLNNTSSLHIVKYSPNGTGILNRTYGNTGGEAFGITHTTDAQGNYLITGIGVGSGNVNFDPSTESPSNLILTGFQADIFVVKYDKNLAFQWVDAYLGNTLNDRPRAIAEKNGNVYLAGYHAGGIDAEFGTGTTTLPSLGSTDIFVTSLNNVAASFQSIELCFGSTIEVVKSVYNQTGIYQDFIESGSSLNKDSIINTHISNILAQITVTSTKTDVSCNGETNGQVTVTASDATTRGYQYAIDGVNFQSSSTFNSLSAGNYTITVKDNKNCMTTHAVTISEPTVITATAQTTASACSRNSGSITVTASGGTGPYTYSIDGNTFQTNTAFNGLAAGQYTVTIKDTNDCTFILNMTIAPISSPTLQILSLNDVSCFGASDGSLQLSAQSGVSPYTYSIDGVNFVSGTTFSGLTGQQYTVIAKDANGCTASNQVTISEPAVLSIQTTSVTQVDCNGASNGSITVSSTGGSPNVLGYEYALGSGSFGLTNTFSSLSPGTYTVTTKDGNDCTATLTIAITEPDELVLNSTANQISCNGVEDGSIIINSATGGTGPYQYSFDGTNFGSITSLTGLGGGTYTVTVKDANDCTKSETYRFVEPVLLIPRLDDQTNVKCHGESTGEVQVSSTGGTGGISYAIDGTTFQTSGGFSDLTAGQYTITAKDDNDCTATLTINITEPTAALSLGFEKGDITCNGENNGEITGLASGGTAPYSYSIDGTNFITTPFEDLSPGSYTLTTKDANDCTSNVSVTIAEPIALAMTFNNQNVSCNGVNDGQIEITATGGTGPYSYAIDDNVSQSENTFTGLASGNYTVTVTDTNGCTLSIDNTITTPDVLSLTATIVSDNSIMITGAGGTAPYEYSIDGTTFQSSPIFSGLANGNFTITIRDDNGCLATTAQSLVITSLDDPLDPITIKAYPNPVTNFLTLSKVQIGDKINLIDLGGRVLKSIVVMKNHTEFKQDISNVREGIFVVIVQDKTGRIKLRKKVIKEN